MESLDVSKNFQYLNKLRNQLGLKILPPGFISMKGSHDKKIIETIEAIRSQMSRRSKSRSREASGGDFLEKDLYDENVISFMFIEKQTDLDYYIKIRCTNSLIDFDDEDLPEYKFPWATFLLYIFLKSMGNKHINLYNDASQENVIYYHKRFLYNLGNKKCSKPDDIYERSIAIPFDIMRGPDPANKKLLAELIESLPKSYKTNSGFRMKVCDIQDRINMANISEIEKYLEMKWSKTINLPSIKINAKKLKKVKVNSITRARSLTKTRRSSISRSSTKKTKTIPKRHPTI